MFVLTGANDEIICINESIAYSDFHRGYFVEAENTVYPQDSTLFENVIIPDEVEVQKYCYTEEDGFYQNQNYQEYVSPEQEIADLKQQITDLNIAIANIMGVM